MSGPIRIFIAGSSAAERAGLAAHMADDTRWVIVGDPARADLVVLSPEEWRRLSRPAAAASRATSRLVEDLTSREHEVLTLLAAGLPNREIAARLGVTEHTVKFHLGAIFGKLGASTRTEAVQKGLRSGVIEL